MRRSPPTNPDPAALLAWYDRHRRDLPWRAKVGEATDPYRVWLSEIMLQQTGVTAVKPYFERFLADFPRVEALAAAPAEAVMRQWAGLGYYARARNLHACAQAVVERFDGRFPPDAAALRSLPGIGQYTAAAIAAIAFDARVAAVDGNVERVVTRLHAITTPLPRAKAVIRSHAETLVPARRSGDFAQAMMDLGATLCTPKQPACTLCPWSSACRARAAGTPEAFPVKQPKRDGLLRRGAAFVAVRRDKAVLLRTRPSKGLLGGMSEVPGSVWSPAFDPALALAEAPVAAPWRRLAGAVHHVFTHFPLELAVFVADVPIATTAPAGCRWTSLTDLPGEALPTLMRKVLAKALAEAGLGDPAPTPARRGLRGGRRTQAAEG